MSSKACIGLSVTSVDYPSAPYQFHKCNFEIIEVWLSFRKLRE